MWRSLNILGLLCLVNPHAHAAGDYPNMLRLSSTVDATVINIRCQPSTEASTIVCKIDEVQVRKKVSRGDLEKAFQQADTQKNKPKLMDKPQCEQLRNTIENAKAGKPLKPDDFFFTLRSRSKQQTEDMLQLSEAWYNAFCISISAENIKKLARLAKDVDRRSCVISTSSSRLTFTKSNYTGRWENVGTPVGDCGRITYSYFERPEGFNEKSQSLEWRFWKFVRTDKITRKTAKELTGQQCADFDESEHLFVSDSEPYYEGCDYIEFE